MSYGKWYVNTVTRPAVILLYHRIIDLPSDPQMLTVSRANFEKQLQLIRRYFVPLSLGDLIDCARRKSIPRKAVVLTFDDGYSDNLEFALPLLEKYDIPATFYVTSGQLDSREEFWWDELEAIFLAPNTLPRDLSITIGGKLRQWLLTTFSVYSESDWKRHGEWHVLTAGYPTERHEVYLQLCEIIRPAILSERDRIMQELRFWAGTDGEARPTHRVMTAGELQEIAKSSYCEVGAHTYQHLLLAALPRDAQQEQIQTGKKQLETILGSPMKSFSYPFGGRQDYTLETIDLVRKAGFETACSNFFGWVCDMDDPFQIPRFIVRDWSDEQLAHELNRARLF